MEGRSEVGEGEELIEGAEAGARAAHLGLQLRGGRGLLGSHSRRSGGGVVLGGRVLRHRSRRRRWGAVRRRPWPRRSQPWSPRAPWRVGGRILRRRRRRRRGGGPKEAVQATMSSSRRTCATALSSSYSSALFFQLKKNKNGEIPNVEWFNKIEKNKTHFLVKEIQHNNCLTIL